MEGKFPLPNRLIEYRPMTEEELKQDNWEEYDFPGHGSKPVVMVFESGHKLYPVRDPEGNGLGVMWCVQPDGTLVEMIPN